MGLESTTYIDGLVVTNPLGTDGKSQGDDHLRLIKSALKNTFPNITGAVTATHTQLNAVTASGVLCFPGMVVAFTGTQAQIPAGWQLCNGTGTVSNGNAIPDLRQKFIQGSTGDAGALPRYTTGGTSTHGHTITVAGHALTIAEMPSHNHTISTLRGNDNGGNYFEDADSSPEIRSGSTDFTGGGAAHSHGASASVTNHLPPFFALAYIVKL